MNGQWLSKFGKILFTITFFLLKTQILEAKQKCEKEFFMLVIQGMIVLEYCEKFTCLSTYYYQLLLLSLL